jgi:hypothetical protein
MSLFGVKQLANTFLTGGSDQSTSRAIAAATESQFDDALKATFRAGDQLQRGIVDFMYNALTLEAFTPRSVMKMTFDMMQQSAEAISLFVPGHESRLAWQEFRNKLQAFSSFEYVDSTLQLSGKTEISLQELVERTEALGPYLSVWATEGLGNYFAETFLERGKAPRNLLKGERADALPARGLAALHAGMGLAIANYLLRKIEPQSSESEIRRVLEQFVALCQDNSRDGYDRAAFEALGLVTRNLYPQLIPVLERHLSETSDNLSGYFWHGIGRAIYFAPTNSLPDNNSMRRALTMTQQEPPHEMGRRNALAGLCWALTLVNIRQPEILELFLKQHGDHLSDSHAFINGVSSSVMIWRDSARGDTYLDALCQHEPDSSDATLAERWEQMVRRPCLEALQRVYPVLKKQRRLGEVFHYLDLCALVRQLESECMRDVQAG